MDDDKDAAFGVAIVFAVKSRGHIKIDPAFDKAQFNTLAHALALGIENVLVEPFVFRGVRQEQNGKSIKLALGCGLGEPLLDVFGAVRRIAPDDFAAPWLHKPVLFQTEPTLGNFGVPIAGAGVQGKMKFVIPRPETVPWRAPFGGFGFGHVRAGSGRRIEKVHAIFDF